MKHLPAILQTFVALSLSMASTAFAAPPRLTLPVTSRVEVFTNASILMTGTQGATVYYVDGLEQIKRQLSQGLPAQPQQAGDIARQRARAMGANLQAHGMNAGEGIVRAAYYGINRVPAIVFDGQSVVLGVTDVAVARAIYALSVKSRAAASGRPQ